DQARRRWSRRRTPGSCPRRSRPAWPGRLRPGRGEDIGRVQARLHSQVPGPPDQRRPTERLPEPRAPPPPPETPPDHPAPRATAAWLGQPVAQREMGDLTGRALETAVELAVQ